MKQKLLKSLLAVALLLAGGNVWAQIVQWNMASGTTYTEGMELSSNTSIVSVTLGGGTWSYNGTWGVEGTPDNATPTMTDNIPTSGNYLVIKPAVDISMSLDTRSSTNHNFVLVEASAPTTYIMNVRARYYVTYDLGTLSSPLQAGKTYYVYSLGGASLGYRAFTAKTIEEYTIHYVDNGVSPVTIKSDVVHEGLYGESVSASGSDLDPVVYNEVTYVYESGNTPITLSTSGNEITLVYAPGSQYDYTINAVAGGVAIKELATGSVSSGSNYGTKLSKVIYTGGNYYVLTDAGVSNYYAEFTMGDADEVQEVEYTLDSSIVYYLEGSSLGGDNTAHSNGDLGQIASQNKRCRGESVGALTMGVYEMESYYTDRGGFGLALRDAYVAGGTIDANIVYQLTGAHNTTLTGKFLLATDLATSCINSGDQGADKTSLSAAFDYVILRKLYDVTNPANIVGAVDKSTDYTTSDAYTLKKGETKVFTFQNHGQDYSKNWRINVLENSVWKSVTRADSWDETAGAATKVAYQVSKDGGSSREALDWGEFQADMDDARVVATLAYGLDGTLAITTTSTGESSGYIYYVDQDVTGLTQELEIRLAVAYSWLEILSVETTAEPATMSIKANKWGTFIAPYAVAIPSGVEAYTVTGISGSSLVKETVETTIPANTPVIVKNTTGEDFAQTFSGAVHANDSYTVGNLTGVYTAATIPASDGDHVRYVLQTPTSGVNEGVQAFYKVASDFTATPNKCYLSVPSEAAVKAAFFELGDADAISDVRSKMEDGRSEIFNLAGQRLNKAQKGVNIINGKKVLVK